MDDDPKAVEDVIRGLLRGWGLDRLSREQRVFAVWEEALGELAKKARPVAVHDGQLVVAVKDNVWMTELSFQKDKLKKKLNQALGAGVIRELRFKIGAWAEEGEGEGERERGGEGERELGPEEMKEAESAAGVIKDPRLREQVLRVLTNAARREKE